MSIEISKFENEFRLTADLILPCPIDKLFPFFSDAKNLEMITPLFLNCKIVSQGAIKMRAEAVIDYHLRFHGLPIRWKTLISHWDPPHLFVDEQLRGPYRYWIHRHTFEAQGSETIIRDLVRYQVYGGSLIHDLFVKSDLIKIFTFRQEWLAKRFSDSGESTIRPKL